MILGPGPRMRNSRDAAWIGEPSAHIQYFDPGWCSILSLSVGAIAEHLVTFCLPSVIAFWYEESNAQSTAR